MSKGVSRKDNDTAGGDLINPSKQDTVNDKDFCFAEGDAICIDAQAVKYHGLGAHSAATMAEESSVVFINGNGVIREDDAATCGHTATGSSVVFAD